MAGSSRSNNTVSSLKTKLINAPQFTTECCIYRVPIKLREVNPEAYTPKLVSIGPFHRGTLMLQPMEVHKLQYLQYFLNKDPQKTIEFYVENLKGLEEGARRYYDEDINYLTSDQFVEMMLIDGCFIVEFMLRYRKLEPRDSNDFLLTATSLLSTLVEDIYLLENQLPFFVIEFLFDLLNNNPNGQKHWGTSFLDLTLNFFEENSLMGQDHFVTNQVKHFADLLQQSYVPFSQGSDVRFIPSATKLSEAGIKFRENTDQKCVFDISFDKFNGVFSIPPLHIDDTTERRFRNLVPFKFFNDSTNNHLTRRLRNLVPFDFFDDTNNHLTDYLNHLTDYLIIMDCLINTSQDVALLRSSGIIKSLLDDNEEVSCVINNICKLVTTYGTTFYYELCDHVNEYCEKPWNLRRAKLNLWRAELKSDYFSNPWSIIALVAAIVVLICTVVQTIYTVFSYYH